MKNKYTVFAFLLLNISLHAMDGKTALLANSCPQVMIPITQDDPDHYILSSFHIALLNETKKYTDLENDPIFSSANYHNLSRALPAFKVEGPSSHLSEYFEWRKAINMVDYAHFAGLAKCFSLKLAQEIGLPENTEFFKEMYEESESEKKCNAFCHMPEQCSSILLTQAAVTQLGTIIRTESEQPIKNTRARLELAQHFLAACKQLSDKEKGMGIHGAGGAALLTAGLTISAGLIVLGISTICSPLTN